MVEETGNAVVLAGLAINAITLIVLAWQIRELHAGVRLQTTVEASEKLLQIDQALIERPELAGVFVRDPTLRGNQEQVRARAFMLMVMNYFETLYILKQKRYMDSDEWGPHENYLKSVVNEPAFSKLWADMRGEMWYYEGFQRYVDSLILTGPLDVEVREIDSVTSEEFRRGMKIYSQSFPQSEDTIAEIRTALQRSKQSSSKFRLLVASEPGRPSSIIGFALFHYLPSARSGFLDYFAISSEWQNKGIGSLLLRSVVKRIEDDAGGAPGLKGVFAELPLGDELHGHRFWKRHGFRRLDIRWKYPGSKGSATSLLAFLPTQPMTGDLPSHFVRDGVKAILSDVYSVSSERAGAYDPPEIRRVDWVKAVPDWP